MAQNPQIKFAQYRKALAPCQRALYEIEKRGDVLISEEDAKEQEMDTEIRDTEQAKVRVTYYSPVTYTSKVGLHHMREKPPRIANIFSHINSLQEAGNTAQHLTHPLDQSQIHLSSSRESAIIFSYFFLSEPGHPLAPQIILCTASIFPSTIPSPLRHAF